MKLKKDEHVEWKEGNLVCISNGKIYRLDLTNKKGVLYNKSNKWLYKKDFDYIGSPVKLISIFRVNGTSRLINIPSGEYITDDKLYVICRLISDEYLCVDENGEKKKINIG